MTNFVQAIPSFLFQFLEDSVDSSNKADSNIILTSDDGVVGELKENFKFNITSVHLATYQLFSFCIWDIRQSVKREQAVDQGSQTRGPRAACGPPNVIVRPASS